MSIFLTGDIHGAMSVKKLGARWFNVKEPTPLTRDDYVIILGDFGLVWGFGENRQLLFYYS